METDTERYTRGLNLRGLNHYLKEEMYSSFIF